MQAFSCATRWEVPGDELGHGGGGNGGGKELACGGTKAGVGDDGSSQAPFGKIADGFPFKVPTLCSLSGKAMFGTRSWDATLPVQEAAWAVRPPICRGRRRA